MFYIWQDLGVDKVKIDVSIEFFYRVVGKKHSKFILKLYLECLYLMEEGYNV